MKTGAVTASFGALALLVVGPSLATADEPSVEALAYTCAGCHGTDGSSVGPSSPHIAGLKEDYFIDSMTAYKANERNSTIMNRIAKGYTDEQITAMAEYFATQKLRTASQKFDSVKAKRGAELHEKYCENCHEDGGRDASEGGTLAGQWMPYLEFSMADFKSGARRMTKKMEKKLQAATSENSDDVVDALIHFYVSQKQGSE
ncbi:MAG: c-type cytochrome [Pseudomonadota bacterium]